MRPLKKFQILGVVSALVVTTIHSFSADKIKAGAALFDISPTAFPAPVNGGFKGRFLSAIDDPMNARALAISSGKTTVVFCVVDACMIPQEICDAAKKIASEKTGVPVDQMLISATHTHSAATLAPVFQSDTDPEYIKEVPNRIAKAIIQAIEQQEAAELGWATAQNDKQVFNRRWLTKEGVLLENAFGKKVDKVRMNPGYNNPDVTGPAGPIDPQVSVLAVRAASDKRPIGMLANYSLHYVGGNPNISADYFGAFAEAIKKQLEAEGARYENKPAFVGILSNGTSGDINNVNYAQAPAGRIRAGQRLQEAADSVAESAKDAYAQIQWKAEAPIGHKQTTVTLGVRKPNAEELAEAKQRLQDIAKDKDNQYSNRLAIFAREAVLIHDYPDQVTLPLQVYRIDNLSIAAIPCETFVEIGLDLRKATPLDQHFTISLANAYHGYLPTPKHHELGGYETWRARSSYLEKNASEKVSKQLKSMLAELK